MMSELLSVQGAIGAFLLSLVIFGFAPGMALAGIVRMIPDGERRQELQAELYEVPRWEQPYWVVQQLEVAVRIGLYPHLVWYWDRWVWHRAKIESGVERHRQAPDTFWIPNQDEDQLGPGDFVKLMWDVKRDTGERMWVRITHRRGDRFVGTLENWPLFVRMDPGEKVRFRIDDIIDYELQNEESEPAEAA